jgi:hypothetical protein
MSCMTLLAQPAMTTSQLARSICFENSITELTEMIVERNLPLKMSWVVVTDEHGRRQLRMHWRVAEADER